MDGGDAMARRTITERDLRTMLDIVARTDDVDPSEPLPSLVLAGLRELIPCDLVVLAMFDARRRENYLVQRVGDRAPVPDREREGLDQAFWTHYWDSAQCCYPDVSGDLTTVTTASDFYSDRELRSTPMYCEYLKYICGEREMMLCLPGQPGRVLRLLFWRGPGSDFSYRDRSLITLLRPHLYQRYQEQQRRRNPTAKLTARQRQLLQLVAAGYTNGQIARRLSISEATVRKHLEHIFERLKVTSRTAAVTRVSSTPVSELSAGPLASW
jgi:DNA-binding CsgD family transcriptional regulator